MWRCQTCISLDSLDSLDSLEKSAACEYAHDLEEKKNEPARRRRKKTG